MYQTNVNEALSGAEVNPPLHYQPLCLQGWSLCFFRSCFRQFTSKWKCRFEGWSKSQKFLANCWVEIHQSQWSVRVIWCFKKPRRGLCGILLRADWIKLKSNSTSNGLWIYTNQHIMSKWTEWLQWKGSADALGAVFWAVFPPLPEHLWVSCIRTPPAQRCSSTRRSNSNLEE